MSPLASAGFVAFILLLFAGMYMSLFGWPGTVIIFLDVLFYAVLTGFSGIGWKMLLVLLVLAVLSEAADWWAGSKNVHKIPASAKSFLGAILGACVGMILLTPSLRGLGIWGGFFLGGLAGLLIAEWIRQSRLKIPLQASGGAFLAMIGQKALKGFLSLVMILISLSGIYS
ncbi:MAG: DUF456 domain-containing protein [Smithellaceae bacterium]|nr:DUF456 domain-containing protein [Smithellaceae bacterium]MDD3259032.1 DUF456 domain-containing protein [Smithellaceae bacterium]MDD3847825.1 DUF456 domain-containing protein [Smithellaceae bacterium]